MDIVSTDYAAQLSGSEIVLNGVLNDMNGNSSLDVYFEWGATSSYGNTTASETLSSTGPFSTSIPTSGLSSFHTAGDFYCFVAKATDGVTTWEGIELRFVYFGEYLDEPYILENEHTGGTLTNVETYKGRLLLDWNYGSYESISMIGGEITAGAQSKAMSLNMIGGEITAGSKTI